MWLAGDRKLVLQSSAHMDMVQNVAYALIPKAGSTHGKTK